jgi:hypothetical protein
MFDFSSKPKPVVKAKPKPKPKPVAKKASKPMFGTAKKAKPIAKKASASKPSFSFGGSGAAMKTKPKATMKKSSPASSYTIKKTPFTAKKSATTFKTVQPKKVVAKPAAAKASAPRAASAAKYDRDLVENYGLVPIFAGTFLLTYAVFPAVIENFLEVVGIGYSAYFAYSYYTSPEARANFGQTLDKVDEDFGLDLRSVAAGAGDIANKTSKQLAEQAEKNAEAAAKKKLEDKKAAEKLAADTIKAAGKAAEKEKEA